jgi:L-fucose isomerase-like protein
LIVTAHPNEVGYQDAEALLRRASGALPHKEAEFHVFPEVVARIEQAERAAIFLAHKNVAGVIALAATWSDDAPAVRVIEQLRKPAFTWAVRGVETGSLCGTQQLDVVLAELGLPCRFWFGEADDPATRAAIADFAAVCGLADELRRLRVGLLGGRTPGMSEIACDEFELRRKLGPEVVPLAMDQFLRAVQATPDEDALLVWRAARELATRVDCDEASGLAAARFCLALQAAAKRHALGAIAVDCYPALMGRFCLAASLLAKDGFVVACESDINAAVAQVALQTLTRGPTHNTDLLDVDLAAGTGLFSHCGCGHVSLAQGDVTYAPVRLANEGLCVLFTGRPGPVTAINLVGRAGTYRLAAMETDAMTTAMDFPGNPIRLILPGGGRAFLDFVAGHALGHHWLIGYGHIAARLRQFAELVDLRFEQCQ